MKLKKFILFAVLPLLLVSCVIAAVVHYQTAELGRQQHEVVRKSYLATKDMEVRNYVALARRSIDHLYESGRGDDKPALAAASRFTCGSSLPKTMP